jgi:hypothetical protein
MNDQPSAGGFVETRRRGPLGKLCVVAFVLANAWGIWGAISIMMRIDRVASSSSPIAKLAAHSVGTSILVQHISAWGMVAVVTGVAAWATRGQKMLIPMDAAYQEGAARTAVARNRHQRAMYLGMTCFFAVLALAMVGILVVRAF